MTDIRTIASKVDDLIIVLTDIALELEREIANANFSDNAINIRNRSRANDTLLKVQAILGDDWLVNRMGLKLADRDVADA